MHTLYTLFFKIKKNIASWSDENKLFFLTIISLFSIYFIPNNKLFLVATCIFILVFYLFWKNFSSALLYVYILLLPFQNGKGLKFVLVYPHLVDVRVPSFQFVNYTMSNFVLSILIYLYIRNRFLTTQKQKKIVFNISDLFLCIFFITNVFSGIYSQISFLSILLTFQFAGYVIPYYFIRQELLRSWLTKSIFSIIASLGIFEGIWTILQFFNKGTLGKFIEDQNMTSGLNHIAIEDSSFLRMQGTFIHPTYLGFFMAIIIPILVYYSISKYSSLFQKRISSISLLCTVCGLIFSGARTAWFFAIISAIAVWKITKSNSSLQILPDIKRFYKYIILFCLVISPIIIIPRIQQLSLTLSPNGGAVFRLSLIHKALLTLNKYPFGIGSGLYPHVIFEEFGGNSSFPTEPHNIIFQAAVSSGLIGGISFTLFLFFIIKKIIHTMKNDKIKNIPYNIYAVSFFTFILISMFFPILYDQQIIAWMFIILALLV